MDDSYERVIERRSVVIAGIEEARALLQGMEAELRELEIAQRVLGRLSGRSIEDVSDHNVRLAKGADAVAKAFIDTSRKPEQTPTVPVMILDAIRDAHSRGLIGLKPKEMVDYIARTYWPEVKPTSVGPIAARMLAQGRLVKEPKFGLYALPENETPAGDTAGVSGPKPSVSAEDLM
jgi:(2Fe-2S) ferredoxin